ncbi:DUF5345 family protein [Clostridium sp. CS001]|uniref:DUF5345 family protein n=1 Tax=Clostridium sp. CS001 TaxID=2880648 RepID=UPI001CF24144|nr:DUF5345 family protein [Clostridium sp. CS001]MCB2288280.1 DUF5345 family protein [Clostridium sp. CS001]
MKNLDKIKNSLIDEFYNEGEGDKNLMHNEIASEFKSKLNSTSNKMDLLNEDMFDFSIDTLSIIEKGQNIREKGKAKKEFMLFILTSIIILSIFSMAIIRIGPKIFIISQIVIITLAPWIVIPALLIKKRGSEA